MKFILLKNNNVVLLLMLSYFMKNLRGSLGLTCILYVNWICNHTRELGLAFLPLNHEHFGAMFRSLLSVDLLKEI